MKTCLKIVVLLLLPAPGLAQQNKPDSLRTALRAAHTDSARYLTLTGFVDYHIESNRDSALYYTNKAFAVAQKNGRTLDEAFMLDAKGYILMHMRKYPESLEAFQQALELAEDGKSEGKSWDHSKPVSPAQQRLSAIGSIHHDMGHLMGATSNVGEQIKQYAETKKVAIEAGDNDLLALVNMNLGQAYERLNRLDSALILTQNAGRIMMQTDFKIYQGQVYNNMGDIYLKKGNKRLALQNYYKAVKAAFEQKNNTDALDCYGNLAEYYLTAGQKDSSLFYSLKTLGQLNLMGIKDMSWPYENLYKSYRLEGKTDSAYKYQGIALETEDSLYKTTIKSLADFQKLSFKAQLHAQELEKEKAAIQVRVRTYILLAAIAVFMLITGIFYRNNRQKQKVNNLLSRQKEEIIQQKEEIESQRDHLQKTLAHLKAAQTQLIQAEKMASLGELTAGIAHEIQNPLNFVNNFSEVNREMLEELKAESEKPKAERDDLLEIELINDLIQNEQKISHHGKRADFIVKGMLEHSRTNTGEKQLTDINVLCDEFLKLSYHGLRGKDKSFNAEMITHFDPNLPKVNVSQQDMGRVMLNLFNNAFYAVNQKLKTVGKEYKPEVTVTTFTPPSGGLGVSVKDNGVGIPDAIKDKIMQPFFTTKPTGEGTGLGLSLTYDMVVKGHGGNISVESKEGEGSEFVIWLPI